MLYVSESAKKILAFVIAGIFIALSLSYIFLYNEETEVVAVDTTIATTTTTSTTIPTETTIAPTPQTDSNHSLCTTTQVLFDKNTAYSLTPQTQNCIESYFIKYYKNGFNTFNLTCRSSADGSPESRYEIAKQRCDIISYLFIEAGVSETDINKIVVADTQPVPGYDPLSEAGLVINRSVEITGV